MNIFLALYIINGCVFTYMVTDTLIDTKKTLRNKWGWFFFGLYLIVFVTAWPGIAAWELCK